MSAPKFISQDSITVPRKLLETLPATKLSIDNGATLSKILYVTSSGDGQSDDQCQMNFITVSKADFLATIRWIKSQQQACEIKSDGSAVVKLTGVNFAHQQLFKEVFNASCENVIEILTQVRGCHWMVSNLTAEQAFLTAEEPDPLYKLDIANDLLEKLMEKLKGEGAEGANSTTGSKFPAVLACLGSGTMISVLDSEGRMSSFHFCMFGGKVLQGMAQLMLGTSNYDEIMSMAEKGDRANVDLLVKEVLDQDPASPYGRFNPELPMMHFGKVAEGRLTQASTRKEDVARSLVSVFCANLFGIIASISTLSKVPNVYFGGNFFRHAIPRREFENFKSLLMPTGGFEHRFIRLGGHVGAVGALVASNADAPVYLKV